jgi:hypothetical protein
VAQYATQLLLALDLLGVAVFALSGALVAIRSHLDVFRVLVLAYATALAGGVTRDVLIGAIPPQGTSDWRYPSLAYTPGAAAIVWHRGIERLRQPILVLDAAGLAVFAVSGATRRPPGPWSGSSTAPLHDGRSSLFKISQAVSSHDLDQRLWSIQLGSQACWVWWCGLSGLSRECLRP